MLSIRVDQALADRLDRLARDCDCSRDELALDALTQFVDQESKLMAAIKRGEEDFAAGRFVTHEQLMDELRATYSQKDAA